MLRVIYRAAVTLLGLLCGFGIGYILLFIFHRFEIGPALSYRWELIIICIFTVFFGIIFFLIAPALAKSIEKLAAELNENLKKMPAREFLFGTLGLLFGLIIAALISMLWSSAFPILRTVLSALAYVVLGYIGIYTGVRKADDLSTAFRSISPTGRTGISRSERKKERESGSGASAPKILDTSVIIDGRIADIIKTGFLEGRIVIPEFVLVELRHIADSADPLKRNRGRRGLDILNRIRKQHGVEIYDTDRDKAVVNEHEVDIKLLELASSIQGKVVTNDYNLNKVASIQGVSVLNINELANTLKPVVLPGEEMTVTPVKPGKENDQALAYLDDGTMVVVEDGRKYIAKETAVIVTSVLQTAAGRMIFAKPK